VDLVRTRTKVAVYHSTENGSNYVVPPAQKSIQLALLYSLGKAFHLKRWRGPSQISLCYTYSRP